VNQTGRARSGRRRRFLGVGVAMLGLPVILWVGAATFIANQIKYPIFLSSARGDDVVGEHVPERTSHPYDLARSSIGVMPDEFKAGQVEFAGLPVDVSGLYFHGRRSDTIILLAAAGGGTESLIPYAQFLYAAGYSVLALDSLSNAHLGTDFGWTDSAAVLKAAAKLRHDGVGRIAVMGISEGGAAAIFAAAEKPMFSAVIADSSYANLDEMLRQNPSIAGLNPAFAATVLGIAEHRWFPRPFTEIAPADAALKLRCPLLVIQNEADPLTPVANGRAIEDAARKSGNRAQLWVAPAQGHGNAIFEISDQYKKQVLDFLAANMS